jgi:methionyl-tRNA formyltransferase
MGSKPGSVVALSILLERGWKVNYVVVSGRVSHPWVTGQTLEEMAVANGIRVVAQKDLSINESVDFVISYMFRDLVKIETISMARRAALNFHAGPLPEYGGWAFYSKAILENASKYGCTCHYMDEGFDTGPLLKVRRFPIDALMETAYSLEQKAQNEMIRLFLDFCYIAENHKELPLEEQDKSKMRYMTQKEFEALKEIPPGADEETIDRYARAFWYPPYTGAYLKVGTAKVEVLPEIVKNHLAELLHADDLERLKNMAKNYYHESM